MIFHDSTVQLHNSLQVDYFHRYKISTSFIEIMILTQFFPLSFFAPRLNCAFGFFLVDEVAKGRIAILLISILIACPLHVRKVKVFNAFRKPLIKYALSISVIQISCGHVTTIFPNNSLLL